MIFCASEIRGDPLYLPIAVADGIEPAATLEFLGPLALGTLALGAPCRRFREGTLGRG